MNSMCFHTRLDRTLRIRRRGVNPTPPHCLAIVETSTAELTRATVRIPS